jgi:hypothetical protein
MREPEVRVMDVFGYAAWQTSFWRYTSVPWFFETERYSVEQTRERETKEEGRFGLCRPTNMPCRWDHHKFAAHNIYSKTRIYMDGRFAVGARCSHSFPSCRGPSEAHDSAVGWTKAFRGMLETTTDLNIQTCCSVGIHSFSKQNVSDGKYWQRKNESRSSSPNAKDSLSTIGPYADAVSKQNVLTEVEQRMNAFARPLRMRNALYTLGPFADAFQHSHQFLLSSTTTCTGIAVSLMLFSPALTQFRREVRHRVFLLRISIQYTPVWDSSSSSARGSSRS